MTTLPKDKVEMKQAPVSNFVPQPAAHARPQNNHGPLPASPDRLALNQARAQSPFFPQHPPPTDWRSFWNGSAIPQVVMQQQHWNPDSWSAQDLNPMMWTCKIIIRMKRMNHPLLPEKYRTMTINQITDSFRSPEARERRAIKNWRRLQARGHGRARAHGSGRGSWIPRDVQGFPAVARRPPPEQEIVDIDPVDIDPVDINPVEIDPVDIDPLDPVEEKKEEVVPHLSNRRLTDIDSLKSRQTEWRKLREELAQMKRQLKTASQLIKKARTGVTKIETAINKLDIYDW